MKNKTEEPHWLVNQPNKYLTEEVFMFTVKKNVFPWFAIACLLIVINCTKFPSGNPEGITDIQAVGMDENALAIIYAPGDADRSVTQNIGLPISGANGSSVSWKTSDSGKITITGIITRPAAGSGDAWVLLTATISKGIVSSEKVFQVTVKEKDTIVRGTVTDQDGNAYTTVKIGNQEWMSENLRVTKYNDGSAILKITSDSLWAAGYTAPTPAYCYYNNTTDQDSIRKFGALYNWFAVNTGKLAPAGWHVPTAADWAVLVKYMVLNGYNWDGTTDTAQHNKIAKSLAAKTDWGPSFPSPIGTICNDIVTNNKSGFSALPGGIRFSGDGKFYQGGYEGIWWSSTALDPGNNWYSYYLFSGSDFLAMDRTFYLKNSGFSVRLVKD